MYEQLTGPEHTRVPVFYARGVTDVSLPGPRLA